MKKQLTNPGLTGEHTGGYPIHTDTVSAPHKENQGGITMTKMFPVIDMAATGANITRLRKDRGLTVRELQTWFGFEEPQAIYKWQQGKSLPSVDNLYALSALLEVSIEEILIPSHRKSNNQNNEQQVEAFLKAHGEYALEEQRQLLPQRDGTGGFYMARMKRCI